LTLRGKKTDENNQRKDSVTQQVLTNRHFVHNTTNNRQQAAHTDTMLPAAKIGTGKNWDFSLYYVSC